ncbi:MAG TPA: DUF4382 domain-containing protein [Gemmatimonadaceae bacterium]|nr:DUF4382 domain-containing protein [Gemmatimonadaceae bacterium]
MTFLPGTRRLRAGALLVAAVAATTTVACADGSGPAAGPIVVQLTDAPMDSVDSVNVYVVRVDAKPGVTDSADAANVSGGGWTTIAEPKDTFELLSLRTDTTVLNRTMLAGGTWSSLRIVIDPSRSYVILKDGTRLDGRTNMGSTGEPGIKFPSAGQSGLKIQLSQPIRITSDTTVLTIDFDAGQSFVQVGETMRDGLIFRPVLRADVTIEE